LSLTAASTDRSQEPHLTVPTLGLGGSKNALVKVTASDGFHTSEAVSDPFVLPTTAPVAAIFGSKEQLTFTADEPVVLRGAAFDLQEGVLKGESLQWFIVEPKGTYLLGSGDELVVKPLPVGKRIIQLVATNQDGKQGTTERTILVRKALSRPSSP
jgi:hypothetical protein